MDAENGSQKKPFDKKAYRKKKYDKKSMLDRWNVERKTQMNHKYKKVKRKETAEARGFDVSQIYREHDEQMSRETRDETQTQTNKPKKRSNFQKAQLRKEIFLCIWWVVGNLNVFVFCTE